MSTYYLEPSSNQKSFYNKASVKVKDRGLYLYSYNTFVAAIIDAEVYVTKDPTLLTATTKRHIRAFLTHSAVSPRHDIHPYDLTAYHDLAKLGKGLL